MDLSIVIVNYNVKHFLKQCLSSVFASALDRAKYEVWVVDNNSVDGSVDMLTNDFPEVNVIANQDNKGFSAANNQAIRQAKGDFVLLLNPDTVVAENTLSTCLAYMHQHSNVGALGVKMLDGTGAFLPESKRGLPTVWNSFCKLTGLDSLFSRSAFFNGYNLRHLSADKNHQISVLCGAFMLLRSSVLAEVGLLDERFFMYAEDIDLSYRIKSAGYDIVYLADTQIIHYKGESSKKGSLSYVKIFYEAMIKYVQKHYKGAYGALFVAALKLAIIARGALTYIRYGAKALVTPAIDLTALLAGGAAIKHLWATWKYNDEAYFDSSPIWWTLVLASLLIVGILAVGQAYRPSSSLRRHWVLTALGAATTLIIYGLLPESYRSSRAIITFLTVFACLALPIINLVVARLLYKAPRRNILIVGDEAHGGNIRQLLEQQANSQVIDRVAPTKDIQRLEEIIHVMQVNELVFSRLDMSMKEVMDIMARIGSKVQYKIAGDDLLAVVGSSSRNHQGEIYTVDISLQLGQEEYRKTKWAFDKILAIVASLLSPICWPLHRLRLSYWQAIVGSLQGQKTWVGYAGASDALPQLRPAITAIDPQELSDIDYAKSYRLSYDIGPFLKYLFRLNRTQ